MNPKELISELEEIIITKKGWSKDSYEALIQFKNSGGSQKTAEKLVHQLAEKYNEDEDIQDQIYDILDMITGWCSDSWRVWK